MRDDATLRAGGTTGEAVRPWDDATFTVHVGDRGRVVLPASIRERLGLHAGDTLLASITADGSVRLASLRDTARRLRGVLGGKVKGRSLAAELVAERRESERG